MVHPRHQKRIDCLPFPAMGCKNYGASVAEKFSDKNFDVKFPRIIKRLRSFNFNLTRRRGEKTGGEILETSAG
ncbi:MAG: hypothetical protein RIB59_12660 [Rhodospirillales bacterium]